MERVFGTLQIQIPQRGKGARAAWNPMAESKAAAIGVILSRRICIVHKQLLHLASLLVISIM